ncbi:acyl carrier protein [Frigoriglobus tundricola]|uniref:Carrier domain-containing protein n=1 Tax=Frigoriglobus tundricola TaxID=2774151 RepID=A0A6M5Z2A4_9BACT|nr:hypothetical protein [Frigoriglobus tundricola]QJW99856.1 hypothetical protein FTUN_7479 [Frigoriglobus tundricola]
MTPLLVTVAGVIGAIAFFAALIGIATANDNFNERFPPISDAEFLARCAPGTNPGVALKVRRIVAKHFGVEYERVYPSSTFIEDLGAD